MAKGNGWLFLILGILVLLFPWISTGSTLQWLETIFGIIIAIVGITMLGGGKKK